MRVRTKLQILKVTNTFPADVSGLCVFICFTFTKILEVRANCELLFVRPAHRQKQQYVEYVIY